MRLQQRSKAHNGKERIILTFIPETEDEIKVMRSITTAQEGDKTILDVSTPIELEFKAKPFKVFPRWLPPLDTRPETVLIQKNCKGPGIDKDEYEAAMRTIQARAMLRGLGVKIPVSIAKKFSCRCGLVFYNPHKFLQHRTLCPAIHQDASSLMVRGQKVLDRLIEKPAEEKKKEIYSCRCGHDFPNKKMCERHQKRCSVIGAASELLARGKKYLMRGKDEGKSRKGKAKGKHVGQPAKVKAPKRKQKEKDLLADVFKQHPYGFSMQTAKGWVMLDFSDKDDRYAEAKDIKEFQGS